MTASQDSTHPLEAMLDQKIEEAELDLADVQVKAVITALCDVLARDAELTVELFDRFGRVRLGKLSIDRLEEWVKEQDSAGGPTEHFKRLLFEAGVDLEDDAVIAAMTVAKDVLIYAGNFIDSVFETLGQQ
jgi:hypothetical protein